jgi:RES domain-containing protein
MSDIALTNVRGQFERHCSLRRDAMAASSAGGRWGPPGAFEVLYLGQPRDSVIVEAYRHLVDDDLDNPGVLAQHVTERRIVTCTVDVDGLLDLRLPDTQAKLDLSEEHLRSDVGDYEHCWAIARVAHQLQIAGIVAPSASRLGETVALFPTNIPVEEWPELVEQDIWRELPPDPRRLRLLDEAT